MELNFINEVLLEVKAAPARTPHPEDAIFDGTAVAERMVAALGSVIADPGSLTIKWDGFPALIFGRTPEGKLTVMDKYMFDKPSEQGRATSPEAWVEYDRNRGKNRTDLYQRIANIWSGLDQAVGRVPGYFWGDLLWSEPLKATKGVFAFKPNVVEYHIPVKSSLGQQIAGKVGGIVVHTYLADETAKPQPWNGQGLAFDAPVAILTPSANIKFTLDDPVQLHKAATSTLRKYATVADSFLAGLDDKGRVALKQYANKKITGQTHEELSDWLLSANITQKLRKFLLGENQDGYLYQHINGVAAVFAIWNAVYAFKVNLTEQLEKQVAGIGQYVNGQAAGEGFVFSTPEGPVKLVQRTVFGQALFAR
jgi:hypothetical protein